MLPITIRSYETLIRLATAHAKLHQMEEIKIKDCIEGFRLMVYCLYGESNAMDDKLKEILMKLALYDPAYFPNDRNEDHRHHKQPKKKDAHKQQQRMEEEVAHGITHKMARIDINKDDKEAEKVLQVAVTKVTKEQKSLVFRAITELHNKSRNEGASISLNELRNQISAAALTTEQLLTALSELDSDGRIHFESKEGKIYLWFLPYTFISYTYIMMH